VRAVPGLHDGRRHGHVLGLPQLQLVRLVRERTRLQQLPRLHVDAQLHGLPDVLLQLPDDADLHGAVGLLVERRERHVLGHGVDLHDLRLDDDLLGPERLRVDDGLQRHAHVVRGARRHGLDDVRGAARLHVVDGHGALHGHAHAVRDAVVGELLDADGLRAAVGPPSGRYGSVVQNLQIAP
jgi:hypothetical protein